MYRNCTFSEIIRDKNFIILSHEVRHKTKCIENKLNGRNLDPNASAAYHDRIKITIPRCLDTNKHSNHSNRIFKESASEEILSDRSSIINIANQTPKQSPKLSPQQLRSQGRVKYNVMSLMNNSSSKSTIKIVNNFETDRTSKKLNEQHSSTIDYKLEHDDNLYTYFSSLNKFSG